MKVKKAATRSSTTKRIKEFADEKGREYTEASDAAAAASKLKENVTNEIKTEAEALGERVGKSLILRGDSWEVGYTETEGYYIDDAKAMTLLDKKLYASLLTVPTPTISEAKFQQAVDAGEISAVEAAQIIVKKPAQKRILVRPVKGTPTP